MTKIFAHRGSSGTHPENTIAAFQEAIRLGVDGIELDIQLTKDHELVVIHDYTLDRTTSGSGKVEDYTVEELKAFDAGSKFSSEFAGETIPTFREVLALLQGTNIELNIEIKKRVEEDTGIEKKMIRELEEFHYLQESIISSFNHDSLKRVMALNQNLECAILYTKKMEQPWQYATHIGAKALHTYLPETDHEMIIEAQQNGFPVRVFTINKDEDLESFFQAKVAGIFTDFPEKAMNLLKKVENID
ncbi:glycerophosphodiester phosphodiesterase [Lederbergia sp. NSJ-179]|uniref:glycerophosphodiester phosphodiesterase n=1 Tax=Lederbergia sp. NSJ-179 TaxID=2931402 RepID=UPI001FD22F2D|nr:glycerophosphodiester phosphodiesterase [Lederbergia sp. NSJ-179]MCJ7842748.1 glycerophosphodiester phosphodiesterase [Lederbergia sp. NSJ-179]